MNDPNSVELGKRYAEIRGIPSENIIELRLPNVGYVARHLMMRELERLKTSSNYGRLAGFALAFDRPYRVDANQSITSTISQGISTMRWQGSCNPTVANPDAGKGPGAVLTTKPAMMLTAGGSLAESVALAERGRAADRHTQTGQIVFLKTEDMARSRPREASMARAQRTLGGQIEIALTEQREPWGNLMGLQTGLATVPSLNEFQFLPGAYADHLTSNGGVIDGKNSQMPATEWIKAGATASFGTVREPCNFPSKFPDPTRVLSNYLGGDTILEAYWKSVSMTTEGLFIGEPLSRPFPVLDATFADRRLVLRANRQTEAFVKRQSRKAPPRSIERQVQLGFFWVETGTPEWIADIEIRPPLKLGEVLATIDLPQDEVNRRSLGVLVRK
ncbi:TIGR03790 family protein [Rhizobium sp. WL3]|uniref:TIGR03790 family protein n=1 Tax=Rhizobium sp. WL3 TaxID=2603277 RepID=UPI001650ADE7|nr:TIGR03790 family protein [Rhizobium sp. WL3]